MSKEAAFSREVPAAAGFGSTVILSEIVVSTMDRSQTWRLVAYALPSQRRSAWVWWKAWRDVCSLHSQILKIE